MVLLKSVNILGKSMQQEIVAKLQITYANFQSGLNLCPLIVFCL